MRDAVKKALDRTDRAILQALQEHARISFNKIGQRVGLTSPAVGERVRRMEDAGVITGYHAELEPGRLGLPLQAFIRLHTGPEKYPRVLAALAETPEVLECHHVTGEASFILRVAVASMPDLEAIIARLSPYGETATSIVLSTPLKRRLSLKD